MFREHTCTYLSNGETSPPILLILSKVKVNFYYFVKDFVAFTREVMNES